MPLDEQGVTEQDGEIDTAESGGAPKEASQSAPSFTPPSFLEALKAASPLRSFGGSPSAGGRFRSSRMRAQPASGTDADAVAVNFLDQRERLIAWFLAAFEVVIGIVDYTENRHYVEHPSKTLSAATAHSQSLAVQHAAGWLMGVNFGLALLIAISIISKRRAAVGFTILLAGLAVLQTGGGIIGIGYLGVGLWIVFRSMRKRGQPAGTPIATGSGLAGLRAGRSSARGAARATTRNTTAATAGSASGTVATTARTVKTSPSAPERKPPAPSRRYTPPQPRKASTTSTSRARAGGGTGAAESTSEKPSRLPAFLRRG